MTLTSLLLFAAVYFAAVATPGPGIAALLARVLGHGLAGVAPFIAGYVIGDMVWLIVAGTGLAVLAKAFAGLFVALKFAGAGYFLIVAWSMATAPVELRIPATTNESVLGQTACGDVTRGGGIPSAAMWRYADRHD